MDCERINELLSAYCDGALSLLRRRRVETHLRVCRRCREDVRELRAMRQLLRMLPQPEPSPAFWAGVQVSVRAIQRSAFKVIVRRTQPQLVWGLSFALVALAGLMLGPRKVDNGSMQMAVIDPNELISLHAALRNDQPLADSGSLRYVIAQPDGVERSNDPPAASD